MWLPAVFWIDGNLLNWCCLLFQLAKQWAVTHAGHIVPAVSYNSCTDAGNPHVSRRLLIRDQCPTGCLYTSDRCWRCEQGQVWSLLQIFTELKELKFSKAFSEPSHRTGTVSFWEAGSPPSPPRACSRPPPGLSALFWPCWGSTPSLLSFPLTLPGPAHYLPTAPPDWLPLRNPDFSIGHPDIRSLCPFTSHEFPKMPGRVPQTS